MVHGRGHLGAACGLARAVRDGPLRRVAAHRARARLPGLRRALALVGDRPRGLLGLDLGLLRGPRPLAVRAGARLARDARRGVVPGRDAELRRAHGRPRRGSRPRRDRRALPDARGAGAHVRRAPRAGRPGARGPEAARSRPRRPRRRLPPEHPGDGGRVPGGGEPRRGLGDVPAGVRRQQRRRPARPARAEGAARGERVRLRGQAHRPRRERRRDPRAAAVAGDGRRGRVRGRPDPRRDVVGGAPERGGAARVRPGAVRASALRPLLVRHDRPAEGDRARPRRDPARAPEEPRAGLGRPSGRPAPVVHDHRLDDVERARLDAAPAGLDRDDRRQPRVPRPRQRVAAGRGDPPDADGDQPRVRARLPQGGRRAGPPVRPLLAPLAHRGRLAAPRGRLRVDLRAGRPERAPHQRQRRHRRLLRHRPGLPAAAGVRGRDRRPLPRRRRGGARRARRGGRRRAGRAGDPTADAVDGRRASGTTPVTSGTAPRTSTTTPASGVTATGSCSPSAGAA